MPKNASVRLASLFTISVAVTLTSTWPQRPAMAQDATAAICANGACTGVDPVTAAFFIALSILTTELNRNEPFGNNNEIVKAINTIVNDLTHGLGPNNDLRIALTNALNDINCGPGPNNELIRLLNGLGFGIIVEGC